MANLRHRYLWSYCKPVLHHLCISEASDQLQRKDLWALWEAVFVIHCLLDPTGVCDSLKITFALLRTACFLVQQELLQNVYHLYGNWKLHLENIQQTADFFFFFSAKKSQDQLKPWHPYLVMEKILWRKNNWPLILIAHYCLRTSYILYISFYHPDTAVVVSLSNHWKGVNFFLQISCEDSYPV